MFIIDIYINRIWSLNFIRIDPFENDYFSGPWENLCYNILQK